MRKIYFPTINHVLVILNYVALTLQIERVFGVWHISVSNADMILTYVVAFNYQFSQVIIVSGVRVIVQVIINSFIHIKSPQKRTLSQYLIL
jgi:hypothetical protein